MKNSVSRLKGFALSLVLAVALSSCASTKTIDVHTVAVKQVVPKQEAPRELNIGSPKFVIITAANFEQYREQFASGKLRVVYGLSEADFKLLLKNQSEYKRFIQQQKAIIAFYETNL